MMTERSQHVGQILLSLGGARLRDGTFENIERGIEALGELEDEDLVYALACVRGDPSATHQLAAVRAAISAEVNLRISRRQIEQAEALRETIAQLKETEGALGRAADRLSKLLPLLDLLKGVGNS